MSAYWDFSRSLGKIDDMNSLLTPILDKSLDPEEIERLGRIKRFWDFYQGYHWEGIPQDDRPQVTLNYCRRFVDKLTSFLFCTHDETQQPFTLKVPNEMESITLPFLNSVWDAEYNDRRRIALAMGQSGGVTGDVFVLVRYEAPGEFRDPFEEYPNGRIRIIVLPSHNVFPTYDPRDRDNMIRCEIKYPVQVEDNNFIRRASRTIFGGPKTSFKTVLRKIVWTPEKWEVWENDVLIDSGENIYGEIPIVHIRNIEIATSYYGVSDIEDVIPINQEINFKMSNNSEIIDYHSAPVTVITGAKVSNLERGVNKVWGGLPKDAKVTTLSLNDDLDAAVRHIQQLKVAMFEIGGFPINSLGGEQAISNTSGVALQIINMPLLEKMGQKRVNYGKGIRKICRLILLLGVKHQLIHIPNKIVGMGAPVNAEGNETDDGIPNGTASSLDNNNAVFEGNVITDLTTIRRLFYDVSVRFPSPLPKDNMLELEQISLEMDLGLEDREGALKRLGRENIQQKLANVDREREELIRRNLGIEYKQVKAAARQRSKIVSGFNNGPEPKREEPGQPGRPPKPKDPEDPKSLEPDD